MAPAKSKDPFAILEIEDPQPVYAVDGIEALVDDFLKAVKGKIFPPGGFGEDFNYQTLVGKETSIGALVDAAQTLPGFAPRRLIVVRRAEGLLEGKAVKEDALAVFLRYLEKPSPTTTLVLATTKWDGRTKLYRAFKKHARMVRFDPPKERDMPTFVKRRSQALGVEIKPDALRALVSAIGPDVGAMMASLEVLSLYVGETKVVTREDVESVVSSLREESIFDLVDALAEGRTAQAWAGLHGILAVQKEPALRALAMVARHYRGLLRARVLRDSGTPASGMASALGVPPFVVDRMLSQIQAMETGQLARALASVATTDRALKGGALDDLRAFERLALHLQWDKRLDAYETRNQTR